MPNKPLLEIEPSRYGCHRCYNNRAFLITLTYCKDAFNLCASCCQELTRQLNNELATYIPVNKTGGEDLGDK